MMKTRLPKIESSEEAIEFGKIADHDQICYMKAMRENYSLLSKLLLADKQMNKACYYATQGQFMREALEITEEQDFVNINNLVMLRSLNQPDEMI